MQTSFRKRMPLSLRRGIVALCVLTAVSGLVGTLSGCGSDGGIEQVTAAPTETTFYGAPVALGNGTVRAYFTRRRDGLPLSSGFELTTSALTNIRAPRPEEGPAIEVPIPMPPEAAQQTPFKSMGLFASPGHPPAGNQDVPHIHPTWYFISDAERAQIQSEDQDVVRPADEELPKNHMPISGAAFPTLGMLWIDPIGSPGWRETPLSTTEYEYRFFNGKMTLFALGVANSFMNTRSELNTAPFTQPDRYQQSGYWPTAYSVRYDAARDVYRIAVHNFRRS